MRRLKLVLAVVVAMVAMMAFAGPALASTFGSCINVPLSSLMPFGGPTTYMTSLLQLVMVAGIVLVAAIALIPRPIVRPVAPADSVQATS